LAFFKQLSGVGRSLSENLAKFISGPLDTVKSFFREHFKSAVRDLCVIFRVILAAI
jgi:hypothetical protein